MERQRKLEPLIHITSNGKILDLLKSIKYLRDIRDFKRFARCLNKRVVIPQSRDEAGCICSSNRNTSSSHKKVNDATTLLSNVAARLEAEEIHIQYYWFLCWSLVCGRPDNAKDDFTIIEDDYGLPWFSRQTLCILPKEGRPSGFALS